MAEKTPNQQLAEKLLFKPAYVGDKSAAVKQEAHAFAEGYKKFLDAGKTEREVAAESEQMLKDAGYQQFDPKKTYAPGDKVYFSQLGKAIVASTIGTRSFEDGFHLVIAHTDSPRLDLRPTPLYESDHFSYFKTHYYGGIRKYQWGTMPLAIHGVFSRADGTTVSVNVGEDENDPVFCITDLLPHLGAEQGERKLSDGIRAEELNILIGSDAVDDEEVKEAVKLNTMILLNEKYGITEKDFARAEIEIVPAYKSRDVGFDRSMIGAYGHDDRVDAYPALMAEIATKNPAFTTVCVLTDKEEIGSDGVTGMQSMYVFHFMQELCRTAGQDDIIAFRNSVCLSADVTAAYDPSWASAFEPMNGTYAGRGIALFKYTGSRGKSAANDASAELVGYVTRMMDADDVAWQIGELGRLDLGAAAPSQSMLPTAASPSSTSVCLCCPCTLPSRSSTRPTCTWLIVPSSCSIRPLSKLLLRTKAPESLPSGRPSGAFCYVVGRGTACSTVRKAKPLSLYHWMMSGRASAVVRVVAESCISTMHWVCSPVSRTMLRKMVPALGLPPTASSAQTFQST